MLYFPPHLTPNNNKIKIFLAGTIDMGQSDDWQTNFINRKYSELEYIDIYNPRRNDWDNSWEQSFIYPQFFQQVTWELDHLDKCDIIFMNFLPDSKSPVTLLELGLYAQTGKLIVVCPKEFWRSGNVEMVCHRHDIPLFRELGTANMYLEKRINRLKQKREI